MNYGKVGNFLVAHFKGAMIFMGCLGVLCIALMIILPATRVKIQKTYLDLSLAPLSAVADINGKTYSSGIYEFSPGTYELQVHADGFQSKTISVDVSWDKTASVNVYLLHMTEGFAYYEKDAESIRILRTMAKDDVDVNAFLLSYDHKMNIFNDLPIDASYDYSSVTGFEGMDLMEVTITNGSKHKDCDRSHCLLVSGKVINKDAVAEAVAGAGYDINDYKVIYEYAE